MPDSPSLILLATPAALADALAPYIRATLAEMLPALVRQATAKPWLTPSEASELTGFSTRTLRHLRVSRQVTFSQRGRLILYDAEDLRALVHAGKVGARSRGARGPPLSGGRTAPPYPSGTFGLSACPFYRNNDQLSLWQWQH